MNEGTNERPDDLEEAPPAPSRDQAVPAETDAPIETTVRDRSADQGDFAPFRPFEITPLHRDDGPTDVSVNHDRYFAEAIRAEAEPPAATSDPTEPQRADLASEDEATQGTTIAIPEDVQEAVAEYARRHGLDDDDIDVVIGHALHDYLRSHGYRVPLRPYRPFRITPVEHDGEETDISINHDKYFADWETSGSG